MGLETRGMNSTTSQTTVMPECPPAIRPDPVAHGDDMTAPMNTEGSRESREQRPLTQLDLDETFPDALADGVAEFLRQAACPRLDPRLPRSSPPSPGPLWWRCPGRSNRPGPGSRHSSTSLTIVAMFAVRTYHRVNWKSPTARKWMKRLDHSMIFHLHRRQLHAVRLLALPSQKGMVLFWIVWGGALGVALKMLWPSAPRWLVCCCTSCWDGWRRGSSGRSCTAPAWRRWCC